MEDKKSFLEKLSTRIEDLDKQLEQMKKDMANAKSDAKNEYQRGIAELQKKRDNLQERIKEFDSAADDAYAELKPALEAHWKEIKGSLDRIAGSLLGREKKAPEQQA